MKLRIQSNSLRLRLSQTEVQQLAQGLPITNTTIFSIIDTLSCTLSPWKLAVLEAKIENNTITIFCPQEWINQWATSEEVVLEVMQKVGHSAPLFISIEKDFACLNPRQEDADKFPHPPSSTPKC